MRKVFGLILVLLMFVNVAPLHFQPITLRSEAEINLVENGPVSTPVYLSDEEANAIKGGIRDPLDVDWVRVIDGVCSTTALGSLFARVNPYVLAFCAGWAIGRFIRG